VQKIPMLLCDRSFYKIRTTFWIQRVFTPCFQLPKNTIPKALQTCGVTLNQSNFSLRYLNRAGDSRVLLSGDKWGRKVRIPCSLCHLSARIWAVCTRHHPQEISLKGMVGWRRSPSISSLCYDLHQVLFCFVFVLSWLNRFHPKREA